MIYIKIHRSYRKIVAICDENLIGKKFEEDIRQLDLRENFYKGDLVEKEEAIKIMRSQLVEDATFNIVGKESTSLAIEAGIINEESVDEIDEIPFALTLV